MDTQHTPARSRPPPNGCRRHNRRVHSGARRGDATAFAGNAFAADLFSDTFEDGNTNGWSKSGGTWSVVTDGSKVLQQLKADTNNARVFAGSAGWTAYAVQARVKPGTIGATGLVGLLARAAGSTTFHRLAVLPGGQIQLQAVNSGAVTPLAPAVALTGGPWHLLRLEVTAPRSRVRQRAARRIGDHLDRADRPDRAADRVRDRPVRRCVGDQRNAPQPVGVHRAVGERQPQRVRKRVTEPVRQRQRVAEPFGSGNARSPDRPLPDIAPLYPG